MYTVGSASYYISFRENWVIANRFECSYTLRFSIAYRKSHKYKRHNDPWTHGVATEFLVIVDSTSVFINRVKQINGCILCNGVLFTINLNIPALLEWMDSSGWILKQAEWIKADWKRTFKLWYDLWIWFVYNTHTFIILTYAYLVEIYMARWFKVYNHTFKNSISIKYGNIFILARYRYSSYSVSVYLCMR